MVLDQETATSCFAGYVDTITDCVKSGHGRYYKLPSDALVALTRRSKSTVINDFIRDELHRRLQEYSDRIKFYNVRGLFLVEFDQQFQARIKKLDSNKRPQNIPTNQTKLFLGQGTLPNVPMATKVIIGYQTNETDSDIKYIGILCPIHNKYVWKLDLMQDLNNVEPLTLVEPNEAKVPRSSKVTVKEVTKNEGEGSGDI